MNILVCLKQILDPEIPARDFRVDEAARLAERGSASLVTNIFCENALETALQLRERTGGATITVLSYGPPSAEDLVHAVLLATGGLGVVLGVLRPQCTTEMCLGLLVVFFVVRTNLGDRAGLP